MKTQTLAFAMERETRNTVRYAEVVDGKPAAIGTLYVQKWLLGNDPPKKLTLILDADQEQDE
jgi:hypothetical protein